MWCLVYELSGFQSGYILGHMEQDWFPQNGQWQLGKLQNKYYHLRRSCVLQWCPLYSFPQDFLISVVSKLEAPIPAYIQGVIFQEFALTGYDLCSLIPRPGNESSYHCQLCYIHVAHITSELSQASSELTPNGSLVTLDDPLVAAVSASPSLFL